MAVNYRYDFNIIVVSMAGDYSINDLRTTLLNALADPERPPDSFLLFDFGKSKSIHTRSTKEMQTMADFITSMRNRYNCRLALVSLYDLPYALQVCLHVMSETYGLDSKMFHSYTEAREWLVTKHLYTSRQTQAAQITMTQ